MTMFEKFEKIIIDNDFVKSVDGKAKQFLEKAPFALNCTLRTNDNDYDYAYKCAYSTKNNTIKIVVCLYMTDKTDVIRKSYFLKVERYDSIYEHINKYDVIEYAKKSMNEFMKCLDNTCNNVIVGG